MLNRWIVLFCLPIFFLSAAALEDNSENFTVGPVPVWVKPCDYDKEALPMEGSDPNVLQLLDDTQVHWKEKTRYAHKVLKVLTQAGAQGLTNLEIGFDPVYQMIVMHDLHIDRDGEIINCLEKSRFKLLQREESLDTENIYSGNLSLIYFLSDLRQGDVLEFSYSVVGLVPHEASHYDRRLNFKFPVSKERVSYRLLIPSDLHLQIKTDDPNLIPKIREISPDISEWSWEVMHIPMSSDDPGIPAWYGLLDGRVQITQFQSWQEVAQKIFLLFKLPEDFENNPSPEMLSLIQQWTESTKDDHERALLALRFVQDEIKYLGFEDGMGGVQPTDPRIVLKRRFGDCKDKSVLLHSLLKIMQISSTPVLVRSGWGKKLPDLLPTSAFNHAILRIEIEGSHYWVDTTIPFQGGSLQTNFCPAFHWGLVISTDTEELTPIPLPVREKPTEILTSIKMVSPEEAELKIERTFYHGVTADTFRYLIKQLGFKRLSEVFLEVTRENYKGASIASPMFLEDDREKNVLKIKEIYKISIRSRLGKKLLKTSSFVLEELYNEINIERSSPYALTYPLWINEHIHIDNPFNEWATDTEEAIFENEAIKFNYEMKKEGHNADFHFELKHLQDHVPLSLVPDYWNIIHENVPHPSLEVVITAPIPKS